MLTWSGRNVVTRATSSCKKSDRSRTVVPVHKIMNSLSRAAEMMRDILYRRPRLERVNNLVSLIFWKTCRRLMQALCNNTFFLLSVLSCKCFLFRFKAVSATPFSEHVQRKEHVFQAFTLEYTWDLNKNCIIVIRDKITIIMHKSYNDMCTNKIAIQRNKMKSFHFGSVYV